MVLVNISRRPPTVIPKSNNVNRTRVSFRQEFSPRVSLAQVLPILRLPLRAATFIASRVPGNEDRQNPFPEIVELLRPPLERIKKKLIEHNNMTA